MLTAYGIGGGAFTLGGIAVVVYYLIQR